MEIPLLAENGYVRNYHDILNTFSERLGWSSVTLEDLASILDEGVEVFYYHKGVTKAESVSYVEPETGIKILETNVVEDVTGLPLCLSYTRRESEANWVGCYVGNVDYLLRKYVASDFPAPDKRSVQEQCLRTIYEKLFYHEIWDQNGNLDYLREYFWGLRKKISADIKKRYEKSYRLNRDLTKVIFNSRLLDHFGNHIHVVADLSDDSVGDVKMIQSPNDMAVFGFDIRKLDIEPTVFFPDLKDVIFQANAEDFDFTNPYSLNHVIIERKARLPRAIQEKSPLEIANMLKSAVNHGVMMSKTDCRFVVPMYNIERDTIQFLMPIYFEYGEGKKPSNALVVDKLNGLWNIRTILSMREAYSNARLLGDPNVRWLSI